MKILESVLINIFYLKTDYTKKIKILKKIRLNTLSHEHEKNSLISSIHINNGHLGCNRTVDKIKEKGYYWENMLKDVINYIKNECKICINDKAGLKLKPNYKTIITKGPKERFVIDGFKLDNTNKVKFGFEWIVEIIDHFSKFLKSYPVIENNANNVLLCIKDFCYNIRMPKIIQTDNGTEYKNSIINDFCNKNKITHIFSAPRHPQTNGVVEVAHRETRKYIINKILENKNNTDLRDILLEANNIHNNNTHTITKFKPIDLIHNTDESIYNIVIENIKKRTNKYDDMNIILYHEGEHIKIKKGAYKLGKSIKIRKIKNKNF